MHRSSGNLRTIVARNVPEANIEYKLPYRAIFRNNSTLPSNPQGFRNTVEKAELEAVDDPLGEKDPGSPHSQPLNASFRERSLAIDVEITLQI